jgi:hypothetical protein
LRWLVRYMRSQAEAAGRIGAVGEWRARFERRLREKQVCGADGGDVWGVDVAVCGVVWVEGAGGGAGGWTGGAGFFASQITW